MLFKTLLKIQVRAFLLLILLACCCQKMHGSNSETACFIPEFRLQATPIFNDCMGGSLLVETGPKNIRLNGTFGVLYDWDERFKITGEFLQQKLRYRFTNGKEERRMQQYAVGASYQQDFCYCFLSKGGINGYVSYAPGKRLGRQFFSDRIHSRHIDGSTAYGGEVNVEVIPWGCASLIIGLDYDGIVFHRKFDSRKYIAGFGGSLKLCQNISDTLSCNLKAEFRRPFNYFEANVQWLPFPALSCGFFGSYTEGKSKLPNIGTAGIELNYAFSLGGFCQKGECCQISEWVATPAVCLPEVLAIAEERVCHFPTSVAIPPFVITTTGFYAISVASYFANPNGEPMVFSAVGLPAGSAINPATGVISGFNPEDGFAYLVTVTATKSCGSTSQSFTISYF